MKNNFKKKLLVLAISGLMTTGAMAQNLGFEDGTTTGWTSTTLSAVGSTTTQAGQNTWVINPYGSYMGQLQIQSGSFNQMSTALGLTSASSTGITSLLQQQAQTGGGNPTPTTAGWVTKEVTLTAGQTFTLAWQYISVDYVPFNDGSIATLTQNGTDVATVNNYNQQYALLGFTNPGTGDYSTGSYGATGWQVATFQVSVDGTYTLGFGVFNLGDTALSPVLYIDEVQGSTTLNGQTFGAVAPNNPTAPVAPTAPTTPTTPTTVSTVGSGTTVDTSNLASSVTVNGGTIQIASTGITLTNTFTTDTNGMTVDQNGNTVNFSGVISGAGGVTIANTSTGGGVTFSAVNTYTGTTTVNSGAGLENTGAIAGAVSNQGTFLNSGTAGNVTNGFNGDGNTAVAVNNSTGTVGNVTNYSSFANSGTTGNVTNIGTFTNTGNVATVNNAGVFNNNTGGTINELGYNNFIVQNSGTINTITYNGGNVINNSSGTIGSINTTQSHGSFNNFGTISGTVTTNGTFNNYASGTVQGLYTNDGTLNNSGTLSTVTNNSALNNQEGGNVTGVITNNGTLNNSGTVSTVTNTGTFTNNSTAGNVTNNGTFTNSGTAGDVTLVSGTFTNTGTVASVDNTAGLTITNNGIVSGAVNNAGNFTNDGNVGSVNNTNIFTNNNTTGDITNSGTTTNNGTSGNVVNNGWFTNALNAVVSFVTNNSVFTNNGTAGDVANTGTFTNNGTTGAVTNSSSFTNAGTTGDVVNTGTFTNTGTLSSINNSGTFNTTGAGNQVSLNNYTQTAGTTAINGNQKIVVSGNAALAGDLQVNGAPTTYGKYTYLTAGSLTGKYDTLTLNPDLYPLGYYLKYTGNDVKLYVTPNSQATQASINQTTSNLANAVNVQASSLNGTLGNDCSVFGEAGVCVSTGLGLVKASNGNLYGGNLIIAKKINENWKAGLFLDQQFNSPTYGGVQLQRTTPAVGGFVTWAEDNLAIQASAAQTSNPLKITRSGPEAGVSNSSAESTAFQLKATYAFQLSEDTTLFDYVGIRHTQTNINGYTEQGPVFPLTVNGTNQNTTDVIAGVGVNQRLTADLTGTISAGVVQNIAYKAGTVSGTSEVANLSTFNVGMPGSRYTSAALGAGLTYDVAKDQRVGINVGWQQKSLVNANVGSVGINYTVGF